MSRPLYVLVGVCVILAAGASPALGAFPGKNGKIAFVSNRNFKQVNGQDVWTMNPDGSDLVNLTPGSTGSDGVPNWSADGRKIVFASDRETPVNRHALRRSGP